MNAGGCLLEINLLLFKQDQADVLLSKYEDNLRKQQLTALETGELLFGSDLADGFVQRIERALIDLHKFYSFLDCMKKDLTENMSS